MRRSSNHSVDETTTPLLTTTDEAPSPGVSWHSSVVPSADAEDTFGGNHKDEAGPNESGNTTSSRHSSSLGLLTRSVSFQSNEQYLLQQQGSSASNKHKRPPRCVLFPWNPGYQIWWYCTAVAALLTVFIVPFQVAFHTQAGTNDTTNVYDYYPIWPSSDDTMYMMIATWIEYTLTAIFVLDIFVQFHLAYYNDDPSQEETIVYQKTQIARHYLFGTKLFWIDLLGVLPLEQFTLLLLYRTHRSDWQQPQVTSTDNLTTDDNPLVLYASLLRFVRFVRLHRLPKLFGQLQYDFPQISLLTTTLFRNFAAVVSTTHVQACVMYFLARLRNFDETTWLGPLLEQHGQQHTLFQRYMITLYWAIVTFATVGYGDFSPQNEIEQLWGSLFMLFNIVIAAWIIGSITLVIVKGDEKSGEYRDSLERLSYYSAMHNFDAHLTNQLKTQLRLEFENFEILDEQILQHFPSTVRRKVVRKLYYPHLRQTQLMHNVRPQFIDAFLAACTVEIFSPGEEIVERGSIVSDLYLLVGGIAQIASTSEAIEVDSRGSSLHSQEEKLKDSPQHIQLEAGEFIGEIGFFTESPQVDTVVCVTVCKMLTISQSSYKLLAQDHPGSVGLILQNLLSKVEEQSLQLELPKQLPVLRVGSQFDIETGYAATASKKGYGSMEATDEADIRGTIRLDIEDLLRKQRTLTAVKDLVKMHMSKQLDDQTTRLLFAASRGDTITIALMCEQGFDANNADYDNRTALMVASMKGNTEVVKRLLDYNADPNMADMHGSTALMEAVKNSREDTIDLLLEHGAKLCMEESSAASVLCQAVFDGDITLLKRLLRAGINANAMDYDKRTAAHIAAAEGNVAAIKVLADHGASLKLKDRWGNTVQEEAKRSNARALLQYLKT